MSELLRFEPHQEKHVKNSRFIIYKVEKVEKVKKVYKVFESQKVT